MNRNLNGWQRIGVILALIWACSSPFVIGPFAEANAGACTALADFKPGGEYAGMTPGALNPKYPAWMGQSYLPNPKPLVCFDQGIQAFFDLRSYPFGAKDSAEFGIVSIIALLVFLAEAGIPLLGTWAMFHIAVGSVRWVRAGFAVSSHGSAEG